MRYDGVRDKVIEQQQMQKKIMIVINVCFIKMCAVSYSLIESLADV